MATFDSNTMPFEVIGDTSITGVGVEVTVYRRTNLAQPADIIPRRLDVTALEEHNADGGGSFKIPRWDRKINPAAGGDPTLLDYGNVVKVAVDGLIVQAFEIYEKTDVVISEGEYAGEYIEVKGPSWVSQVLRSATVHPWKPVSENTQDTRYMNFAAEGLPGAGVAPWVNATTQGAKNAGGMPWSGFPAEWPTGSVFDSCQWMWDRDTKITGAPAGHVFFRNSFTTATSKIAAIYCTADNKADVYLNGEKVLSINEYGAWKKTWRADMTIPAGTHYIGVDAQNVSGPAGVLIVVVEVDTNGNYVSTILDGSGTGWKVNPYPAQPPGWTPGGLMTLYAAEASARNAKGWTSITLDFDGTLDSAGATWPSSMDWPFSHGTRYRDVIEALAQTTCDWGQDPIGMKLRLWLNRGTDRTVTAGPVQPVVLRPIRNIIRTEIAGTGEVTNSLLVKANDKWFEQNDLGTSIATYGRIEGFLSLDQDNGQKAAVVTSSVLAKSATPDEAPTIKIIARPDCIPWVHFSIGDLVWVEDDTATLTSRRVMSIALSENPDTGRPEYEIEFDTIKKTADERRDRWLKSIGQGNLGGSVAGTSVGGTSARTPTTQSSSSGPVGQAGSDGVNVTTASTAFTRWTWS